MPQVTVIRVRRRIGGRAPENNEQTINISGAGEFGSEPRGDEVRNGIRRASRLPVLVAMLLVFALVAAACGSDSKSDGDGSGSKDEGKPQSGGTVTYALEGKTTNFCIPGAQLAISGILIVEAVYDTLTRPTEKPDVYSPYLAKSVTPNDDYSEWTIEIRDGITFHDGTPLTAEVVKQNIDAWRDGLLLGFMFQSITDTAVVGNAVVVSLEGPWVAFPAYLWNTGRTGVAAPAQLDSEDNCSTDLIGTGPFSVDSFDPTTGNVKAVKNESYWRKGFPYLDGINFIIQEQSSQRLTGLEGGQFDMVMSSGGKDLADAKDISSAEVKEEPTGRQEISHMLVNVTRPPLDDVDARRAVLAAVDREKLNIIDQAGAARLSNQVFDTKIMGYLEDPGYQEHDPKEARKLVEKVKAKNGGTFAFTINTTQDASTQKLYQEVKRQLAEFEIDVTLAPPVDQATLISNAIGGTSDAFGWRNYPGQDPDTMYVWFYGGSIVNFNHVDDPVMNEALDAGRAEPDPDKRRKHYEDFNRQMAEQAINMWTWYTQWFVAHAPEVNGITGPNLPDPDSADGAPGDAKPVDLLVGYHQMLGLWKSK